MVCIVLREVKKKKKKIDGFSPTYPKTPPCPPPKCGLCFFSHHCFIVLFQFLDIFFTLKVKKIREKWIRTKTPPPHCGLNPSKCCFFCFCFFLTSLIWFLFTVLQESSNLDAILIFCRKIKNKMSKLVFLPNPPPLFGQKPTLKKKLNTSLNVKC